MDIKDFHPSITEETLDAAIIFAQMNTSISNGDIQIIKHSKKSLVFHNTKSCLDVTIGSHDGAEVGEFVGTFILSHPTKWCWVTQRWWFDCSKELRWQQTDRLWKNIVQLFKKIDFKIEIKTNLIEVDFLNVTFSFIKEKFWPNKKPNNNLSYKNHSGNQGIKPKFYKRKVTTTTTVKKITV